jgi:hypothetical protein
MIIIGVDYHPSFQQIAFMDKETAERGERRLNHSDGSRAVCCSTVSVCARGQGFDPHIVHDVPIGYLSAGLT